MLISYTNLHTYAKLAPLFMSYKSAIIVKRAIGFTEPPMYFKAISPLNHRYSNLGKNQISAEAALRCG